MARQDQKQGDKVHQQNTHLKCFTTYIQEGGRYTTLTPMKLRRTEIHRGTQHNMSWHISTLSINQ